METITLNIYEPGAFIPNPAGQPDGMTLLTDAGAFIFSPPPEGGGETTVTWSNLPGKPSTFAPSAHASTHATGGSDPISPASIGAASVSALNVAAGIIQEHADKLAGIENGANNYTLPVATTTTIGGVKRNTGTAGQFVNGIDVDGNLTYGTPAGGGGGGGGDAMKADPLSQFAATTSAQLAGVLTDETGTGSAVFAQGPTLIAPALGTPSSGNLQNCTFPSTLATLTGAETLTNKTLTTPILSATASGTTAGRLGYSSGALSYGTGSAQRTLATIDGTETLTNKTLTSPTFTAPVLGTPASGNLQNCTFPTLNQSTTGNAATVTSIAGHISAGTNITIAGSGTTASPFVISASGELGGTVSAGDLTGTTLASNVVTSSLTTVGTITSGTWQGAVIAPAYLGTGTSITTKFLRGDGTWQTLSSGGDASTNTSSSVDSEVALFSGTGGKTLKRATGSGVAKLSSGVLSTSNVSLSSEVTGTLPVANGGTGRNTGSTAYGIIAAGTTATGNQQTIAPGTAGHFLKSAGTSALASFAAITTSDVSGLSTALSDKVDKIAGKGLSTNDFTDAYRNKLFAYPDTPTSESENATPDALVKRDSSGRAVARGYRIFSDETGTLKVDISCTPTANRQIDLPDRDCRIADFPETITESGTTRTLAATDKNQYIRLTSASSCTITVPLASTVEWKDGDVIYFRIAAAGIPTITEATDGINSVVVNNKDALSDMAQHDNFALRYAGSNVWDLI